MNRHQRTSNSAFVLIELVIVISIIAVIAAIAIPNLLDARKGANESAAISTLRTLVSVQALFWQLDLNENGLDDYAETLAELQENGNLIDDALASGFKQGYCFVMVSYSDDTWHAHANPNRPGRSGDRFFFVDETGIIRFNETDVATAADDPIEDDEPEGEAEERPSEHGLTGCGAAEGPKSDQLTFLFTQKTIDQLAKNLPPGYSAQDALALLNDQQFLASVDKQLDGNNDQMVDLSEILQIDILAAARIVRDDLFPNDPDGEDLGKDERLQRWTRWYQKQIALLFELDANKEEPPPKGGKPSGK